MWPGERVVGALLLLWEIIKSPEGGRRAEYRESWCVDCGFDGTLFDATLGSMAKPTSSKWQVMHGIIKGLLPILQPVSAPHPQALMGAAATPSYLERFLDVNAQLNRGTLNPDKPARVAHPHCHKVGSPRPCIHVYACMYACVSMHISWLRFTPTLCRLISFEASSRTALWKRP